MTELYENVNKYVQDLFNVSKDVALYILIGAAAVVVLLLLVILILIIKGIKKSKAKKKAKKAAESEVKPVTTESTPVVTATEVKTTTTTTVTPTEEVKPVVTETKVEEKVETKPVVAEKAKEVTPTPVAATTAESTANVEEAKSANTTTKNNKTVIVEEYRIDGDKGPRTTLGKFEVFPINDVYLYRLKASNGEIMVTSEIYKTEKGAISAIETVKKNVESGGIIQISKDKHDLWQFRLLASNKRLLVVSANYTTQQGCESAMNSFKKFAAISPITILEDDPDHLMEEIHLENITNKPGGKIIISESENGKEFECTLVASNSVLLCSSGGYKTKDAVMNSATLIKEAIDNGKLYVVKDKNKMYQFKLYNSALRCVIIGEAYKNKAQAISSANSVASFITLAEVVDTTMTNVTN